MTRRNAVKRLLVGVPYGILYVLVLFPLALAVGVLVGVFALLNKLVTGRLPVWPVELGDRIWSWAEKVEQINDRDARRTKEGIFSWQRY